MNNLATIIFNDKPCHSNNLNKALFEYSKSQLTAHAGSLSLQGAFLQIQNVDEKISNTLHYNWKLNDELLRFCVKARLNILPTNFTYIFGIAITTQGINSVIIVLKVWRICSKDASRVWKLLQ